ncbi:MAG: helix-turn-helix domain-containing protein [Oscillibacter sp.]|jgi:transcriptional regulator with XRE-family HTH domain|nr:helix-turn-helix domain-containing protein [Oscillibacter sp.]
MNEPAGAVSPQTLGQRIQEGRRAANLSQEALGEKLEVSRQAVSKWESDAAVPELDKLIAMSRLFGITVGQLLGVEGKPEENGAGGALTERELAAAEAIAEKYAAQAGHRPRWGRKKKWIVAAACLAAAAGIVGGVCRGVFVIHEKFSDMQAQVDSIQGSVAGQIGAMTSQFQSILDEQNDLLADSSAVVTNFDSNAGTVTLRVTAMPRELPEGTGAVFSAAMSDGRKLTAKAQSDGGSYSVSDWVVPMDKEIRITAAFTGGGATYSALIGSFPAAKENFSFRVFGSCGASWTGDSDAVSLSGLDLSIDADNLEAVPLAGAKKLEVTAVDACFYRNLETTPEKTFPVDDAPALWKSAGRIDLQNRTGFAFRLTLGEGDTVVACTRIRDNYGRTAYAVLGAWERSGGELRTPEYAYAASSYGDMLIAPWTPGTALS